MADNTAVVVDWYGPYNGADRDEALKAARVAAGDWTKGGLYAAIGHTVAGTRGPRKLLYMGVGSPLKTRLNTRHHKLSLIPFTELWLGEISVAGIPGRRRKKIDPLLDTVEWASAYFLECHYNEKKRGGPPVTSLVVLNRWWCTDYEKEGKRPAARWADLIEFDLYRGTGNLVWFGKRARVKPLDIGSL